MLQLVVVDSTAESRSALVSELQALTNEEVEGVEFLPRISIRSLSPTEIKFSASPDILVLGSELINAPTSEIVQIRKALPEVPILARVEGDAHTLLMVDQLARLGVDDTFDAHCNAATLWRKIVILKRRSPQKKSGTLILIQGGKGGVGVTTITAALGESLTEHSQKVLLIDADFDTQDLSRFLQVRPFINETLQQILDQTRPLTEEFLSQAVKPVWPDDPRLVCMTPPPDAAGFFDSRSSLTRNFLNLLECVDGLYDYVLIDAGSLRGAALKFITRVADVVVFVIQPDPAAVYASAEGILQLRELLSPASRLVVLENSLHRESGLSSQLVREELIESGIVSADEWAPQKIPFCKRGARWPGLGLTLYSISQTQTRVALKLCGDCITQTHSTKPSLTLAECFKLLRTLFSQAHQYLVAFSRSVRLRNAPDAHKSTGHSLEADQAQRRLPWSSELIGPSEA